MAPPAGRRGSGEGDEGLRVSEERAETIFGHAFLQAIMQSGYLPETEAIHLYKRILNVDSDAEYLAFISNINSLISLMGFELRRASWPPQGDNPRPQVYIGFVNTEADQESKRATAYRTRDGKPDIRYAAFFRALLERIAEDAGSPTTGLGSVSNSEAWTIPIAFGGGEEGPSASTGQPTFHLTDREVALDLFVKDGWLASSSDDANAYCLGPRSFLELGPMLANMELQPLAKAALQKAIGG